jgi:hypothetical protein
LPQTAKNRQKPLETIVSCAFEIYDNTFDKTPFRKKYRQNAPLSLLRNSDRKKAGGRQFFSICMIYMQKKKDTSRLYPS